MRFYARRRRLPTVIIVSLIDIFVILLIFVIVTTTFKHNQPQVDIKLPKTRLGVDVHARTDPILLTIDKDDKMYLDDKPVTTDNLKDTLVKMLADTPDRPLALRGDAKASFGIIVKVFEILKEAGVKQENIPAFTEKE